jgi:gamma-aminobutyric acid receptor subunit beta
MMRARVVALVLVGLLVSLGADAQEFRLGRPLPEAGPTEVTRALAVVDVLSIDDVNETFTLDFVLRAVWHDPRLAWEPEEGKEVALFDLDEVWYPPLMILNEQDLDRLLAEQVEVQPDGSVQYQQRFRGVLSSALHLREFPFDTQRLSIRLLVTRHSPEEITLRNDASWTLLLETAAVSGWKLQMAPAEIEVTELPTADASFPGASFTIVAEREVGYFLWTMAVPLALILFMAWMVFWIDPNFLPSQVGVATASVFSLIAYRTALRLSLPKVSYMTRADIFVLGATALVFGALWAAIATGRLAKDGKGEAAQAIDRWARWIYVGLLLALLLVARNW